MELSESLKQHFGYDAFRKGQEAIVRSVLSGRPTIAILPTGGGKSLCYQLPALLLEGTTVVVSPLVALMKDQVDALRARGIAATFINSSLAESERQHNLFDRHVPMQYLVVSEPDPAHAADAQLPAEPVPARDTDLRNGHARHTSQQ